MNGSGMNNVPEEAFPFPKTPAFSFVAPIASQIIQSGLTHIGTDMRASWTGEFLNTIVIRVSYKKTCALTLSAVINGNSSRVPELSVRGSSGTPFRNEITRRVKLLHTIKILHNKNIPASICRHAIWIPKLTISCPIRSPRGEKLPGGIKLLNSVVDVVRNINVIPGVNRNSIWCMKVAIGTPSATPHSQVTARGIKDFDSVILQFDDKDIPGRVNCDVKWVIQFIRPSAIPAKNGEQIARG